MNVACLVLAGIIVGGVMAGGMYAVGFLLRWEDEEDRKQLERLRRAMYE